MKADRHRQDIYAGHDSEENQPQKMASKTITERQRELRRHQITSVLIGMVILSIVIGLTYFIIMWQKSFQDDGNTIDNDIGTKSISLAGADLDAESEWVRDYKLADADPTWDGEGERPFSALWIKKAALNIHWAEVSTDLGKNDKEALKTAAKYYQQALEIFPDIEDVKGPLANVYLQLERYDDAIALYESIPDKELTQSLLNNIGEALTSAGKYEQAETCLKKALEKQPNYAAAMINLATLYREQNVPAKAIDAYEKYLSTHKDAANASSIRHTYGLYIIQTKDWKRAAEQFRILTKEHPADAPYFELLAMAEEKLGNIEAAYAAQKRYSQLTESSNEE